MDAASVINLTWPATFAILGVAGIVVGAIVKLMPSKDKEWKDAIQELENKLDKRLTTLELNYPNIRVQIEEIKNALSDHEDDARGEIQKLDAKIEKLTDLLIDLVSGKR